MDWNEVLDAGDVDSGVINVVVEIPMGSNNKIEWKRDLKVMNLDRIDPKIFAKPTNYGFIPQTLDVDGDELDALVITDDPLPTGVYLKARVLGVMKFVDGGDIDDKIICVPEDDRTTGNHIKTLEDIPEQLLKQITFHFNHYKDLKKAGDTEVKGIEGYDEAIETIHEAEKRWQDR
jgi:inorganic pyrophosphatase